MRKMSIFSLLPFVVAVVLSSCSRQTTDSGVPVCEITAPLDSLFSTIFQDSNGPGGVVIVRLGDSIMYNRSFVLADLDKKTVMTDSTVVNVASASKTYVTAALVKLRDDGHLSLDDKLNKFFPNFTSPIFGEISLRHVLSHTSGLPDLRPLTDDQWEAYIKDHSSPFGYGPDYRLYGREEELTRFFETLDSVKSAPGSAYEYQNAPYLLLPAVIENVTGCNFESWMQENIFEPAELNETEFYDPANPHPRMAHAYTPAKGPVVKGRYRSRDGRWDEYDYGEAEFFLTRADHGICTTPRDFIKWIRALYGGTIVSDKSLREVNTPVVTTDNDSIQYGLGLYVQDIKSRPLKVFHNRSNGGFAVFEAVFPRQDVYYLIFTNRNDWDRLATSEKVDSILKSHHLLLPKQPERE